METVCIYMPLGMGLLHAKTGVVHVSTADSNVTDGVACTDSYSVIEVATCGYSLLTAFDRGSSKIGSCSCLIVSNQGKEASFDMWTRL